MGERAVDKVRFQAGESGKIGTHRPSALGRRDSRVIYQAENVREGVIPFLGRSEGLVATVVRTVAS
jgi:hypothetical protein